MTSTLEENPLVRWAAKLAAEAGEPTPLRTLEELRGLMLELEDRFPGVSFGEILADKAQTSNADRRRIRATLKRNGTSEADLALVCPRTDEDLALRRRIETLQANPYFPNPSHPEDGRL